MSLEEGACVGMDPFLFDIEAHGHTVNPSPCRACPACRLAVRTCMSCDVSLECLQYSLKNPPDGLVQAGSAWTKGKAIKLTA